MKLPVIYPQELIKILKKMGFEEERQRGSHITFTHKDGRIITVPFHSGKPIPPGLFNKLIKQDLRITREELEPFL